MNAMCGDCGSAMRQTYSHLTFAGRCEAVPTGLVCTNEECRARHAEQNRADRDARDEAALERALAAGVIVPDDTPEHERWVNQP